MAGAQLGTALRQIRGLFEAGTVAGLTDGQLLDRYLARRDESAFAALVMRHGPMVLGVCHSILRGSPEVEDAFQATFLVLIKKAGTIRGREAVGGWLHRVAHRVAVQAGRDRSQTGRREHGVDDLPDLVAARDVPDDDWLAPLHEELARLPERLRQPIVLCYLEGKSQAQASLELRWSEATLRRRLADARELLRARLTRRGVAVSAALAAATAPRASAAVPPAWTDALTRIAAGPAAGGAASAAAARLAGRVGRGLLAGRVWTVANVATLLLTLGLAAGHLVPAGPARADDPARSMPRPKPAAARPAPPAAAKPNAEGNLTIRGRVLDPDGKPFAGAKVYSYRPADPRDGEVLFTPEPPPMATSGADGRFRFAIPDLALEQGQVQPSWTQWSQPTVVVLAQGFGPAWAHLSTADQAGDVILKLVRDVVPIEGRIVDLEGRPIPGVTIRPVGLFASPNEDLADWEAAMARSKDLSDGAMNKLTRIVELFRWRQGLAATTDDDGRFRMTGIGRERLVPLWIEGPTIATSFAQIYARTRPGPSYRLHQHRGEPKFGKFIFFGATFEYAAAPTRAIEGTVRDKATGRPLAGVSIRSERFAGSEIVGRDYVRTTTGPDGRYRLVGMPTGSGNRITAHPGPSQPYVAVGADVPGGAGPEPAKLDFALRRGAVTVRGKVTDKVTGQPVPSVVEYFVFIDNPHREEARGLIIKEVRTRSDGSFVLAGLPGRGLVAAWAQRDYYLVGKGAEKIPGADPEHGWYRTDPHLCDPRLYHAIVAIEPAEDARTLEQDLALDPGITLSGHLIDPDGRPVAGCTAIELNPHTRSLNIVKLDSDAFTARALDPKQPRPLVFRHDEKKLTAVVVARGDEKGPLTVRLQPAGSVTGRLLDNDGQPRHDVRIEVRYAKGQFGRRYFDPFLEATPGDDGRFRIEGLIPGVAYDLAPRTGNAVLGNVAAGLKLQPGEARDLGDARIKWDR